MRSIADCCERAGGFCGEALYAEIVRLRAELASREALTNVEIDAAALDAGESK